MQIHKFVVRWWQIWFLTEDQQSLGHHIFIGRVWETLLPIGHREALKSKCCQDVYLFVIWFRWPLQACSEAPPFLLSPHSPALVVPRWSYVPRWPSVPRWSPPEASPKPVGTLVVLAWTKFIRLSAILYAYGKPPVRVIFWSLLQQSLKQHIKLRKFLHWLHAERIPVQIWPKIATSLLHSSMSILNNNMDKNL